MKIKAFFAESGTVCESCGGIVKVKGNWGEHLGGGIWEKASGKMDLRGLGGRIWAAMRSRSADSANCFGQIHGSAMGIDTVPRLGSTTFVFLV